MSHTTQKTTVLPQVVHTPAFASIPLPGPGSLSSICQAPRRPARNYTPYTQTSLCCTVYSEDDHTRPQRKRTCAEENPNCDSAPWVGSSRHVGARSRRETPLFPMCDSAPRDVYGRPEQVGARSRGKGYIAPRHVVTQGLCVCSLPIPRGSVAVWDAALRV